MEAFHHHGPITNDEASIWKRRGIEAAEYRHYPEAWKVGYEPAKIRVLGEAPLKTLLENTTQAVAVPRNRS